MQKDEPTTFADRTSTGVVNGVLGGVSSVMAFAGVNSIEQLLSKNRNWNKVSPDKTQWKIIGAISGISTLFGFFTANRTREKEAERAMDEAREAYLNAPDATSKKVAERELEQVVENIMDGKPVRENTHFQDMVTSSRQNSHHRAVG